MQEIRCGNCHKKLAEGHYTSLAIKCHRCKTLNQLSATRAEQERPSASNQAKQALNHDQSHHPVAGRQTPSG